MESHCDTTSFELPPSFFLFGLERSGTTLLSMMVGAHPCIAVPLSTTGLWYRYGRMLDKYNALRTMRDVEHMVTDLLQEERIRLWDVNLTRDEVLDRMAPGNYSNIIARFHGLYAQRKGKAYWGNLDISTLDNMDIANLWFPQARFLHIVRDGRDVALSHETMPYGASNVAESAEMWVHRLQVNLKMGAILGPSRYMVVHYEDLVLDSEATLRRMCEFMGVAYSAQMLAYPAMVEEKVPEDRRWLWPALNKPPVEANVFRWKKQMSPTKRIVFEGAANSMLKALGYEAYEKVPKRLCSYLYDLWYFLGKGGRFKRLATKFGIHRLSKLEREWRARHHQGRQHGDYRNLQRQTFGTLVHQGVYSVDFEHARHVKQFVADCVGAAVRLIGPTKSLAILDCGCGTGAWLDFLSRTLDTNKPLANHYYGFDVTPDMIEVARQRLNSRVPPDHLHEGDILQDEAYVFNGTGQTFDLVFVYDVIQQLPSHLQLAACETLMRRLAPGGVAVIFDHDRHSLYGLKMGAKKFLTRYLNIRLVPEFYCNASYPSLTTLSRHLQATDAFSIETRVAPDGRKRALIARALGPSVTVS